MKVLRRLDGAHHVESLLPSKCGKTQMARTEADGAAIVAECACMHVCTVKYCSCFMMHSFWFTMTVNVFSMNIAGCDA